MENYYGMQFGVNLDKNRERKVVFYGRVSTEHEAQLSALQNQLQWYDDQAIYHPNWKVLRKYIDEGITGTQAKKRPAFLEMIQDARLHKFDLIVTREVCRFARNTVDTLVTTRELKNMGIEVYFVEDNIWTMDGDGELRLTIMATLAQEESRKTSERVKAGQKISRDKGVLYGSGNILGYDRVGDTYVINEDQARTVKMIYDLYEAGYGMGHIRDELIRQKRLDGSGLVRWEQTKISRILHNATYKGYQGYNKSFRNNFLDQKIIKNHDEDTYIYVKGKFEPIISEEQWERVRVIRDKRKKTVRFLGSNGISERKVGVNPGKDIWTNKLKCRCGSSFRKNKWRKNRDGEIVYGYKCYNQLNNGSSNLRIEAGLDVGNYCNLRELTDWKFEMMARHILKGLWGDKKDILEQVGKLCKTEFHEEVGENLKNKQKLLAKLTKIQDRMKRLTEMRMDDEISKEDYLTYRNAAEKEKTDIEKELVEIENNPSMKKEAVNLETIKEFLLNKMDFSKHYVDRDILDKFIKVIIPETETSFLWYMNFGLGDDAIEDKKQIWEFKIDYAEAWKYKHEQTGMLRKSQWEDLTVKVFV